MPTPDYKQVAREIFLHAVEAVHPYALTRQNLLLTDKYLHIAGESIALDSINRLYITGAGKAAAPMAKAAEDVLGSKVAGGIVIVKYGHTTHLKNIKIVEAAHPVPDENGLTGTRQLLGLVSQATARDLVINLISGGGSALLIDLPPGCTLQELQDCFNLLLRSGASIEEVNTVRKHLSGIKGGQLAKAVYPARLLSLILSDVIGNPLEVIASGPTVADPTTFAGAWQVMEKYQLLHRISGNIRLHLQQGVSANIPETPKPGDSVFTTTGNYIIGSNAIALQAAAKKAEELGLFTIIAGADISGDAVDTARQLVFAARLIARDQMVARPACLLMGGETTVAVTSTGKGGRNQHLALAAALQLTREDNIVILSAGTDGTDGPTEAAGAVVDAFTVPDAASKGLEAKEYLLNNDSYHFFQKTSGHIITGPTMTNVMDIMLAIIY